MLEPTSVSKVQKSHAIAVSQRETEPRLSVLTEPTTQHRMAVTVAWSPAGKRCGLRRQPSVGHSNTARLGARQTVRGEPWRGTHHRRKSEGNLTAVRSWSAADHRVYRVRARESLAPPDRVPLSGLPDELRLNKQRRTGAIRPEQPTECSGCSRERTPGGNSVMELSRKVNPQGDALLAAPKARATSLAALASSSEGRSP